HTRFSRDWSSDVCSSDLARNIQRQASRPNHRVPCAPPAAFANSASDSSAAKMPRTIASCCSEANRPRTRLGEISAMYAGATTEADRKSGVEGKRVRLGGG